MPKYSVELRRTGNVVTIGTLSAATATLRRGKLQDLVIGCDDAAGDVTFINQVQRITAIGTATPIVPAPTDVADAASGSIANNVHTVEPTYTAATILLSMAMNQRTTMHWIAPPGGDLIWPAINLSGLGIKQRTASALTQAATCQFED